ncbi:MAG: DUF4276 family protein [Deltaproteobacteria bacterium]|nr:DUF4276 family protein [Deltaproteobacteria bacterium]
MKRVHVICEGPTEQTFVRQVLQPVLPQLHLIAILPGKTFGRGRGGAIKYDRVKPDIVRTLKHDRLCCCTTFFDYYGLGKFPSTDEPRGASPERKSARIEDAIMGDVCKELGPDFIADRFRPYLSMHEFEGLLFSDPRRLAEGLYRPDLEAEIVKVRASAESPEHIDDGTETAPSKRLKDICAGYDKITGGNVAALAVGIDAMMRECAHFRRWMDWFDELSRPGRREDDGPTAAP